MLADAERTLRAGIAYCNDRDLDTWTLFMTAELAIVLVDRGRSNDAGSLASRILRHPHLSRISRIPALLATARIAVRAGDPQAQAQLGELDLLAADSTQAQHLLQVGILRAEAAWTAGRGAEIVALTQQVWSVSVGLWEPWMVAELAWWRASSGGEDAVPSELPEPFALMRDGRVREASQAWTAIGRPFWAALALAGGGPADTSEAVAGLLRLDAPSSAQAVRRDLARRGLPVPRGPRAVARANTAGLTAREVDVLRFLVDGLSDAEIAATLTLSQRTVGHHTSAILRKLDVPSRARAAAAAKSILTS
jgi:DNA-binding CsgD family transcriptional regulator